MHKSRPLASIPLASIATALLSLSFLAACGPSTPTPTPTVKSIALTCTATTIADNSSTNCTATAKDANGKALATQPTFTYASSAKTVATIDTAGKLSGVAAGTTSITATTGDVTSNAVQVTVTPTLRSITLTCAATTLTLPGSTTCTATGLDVAGNALPTQPTFTYASSETSVATINASGAVSAVAAGSTNITATANGLTSNTVTLNVNAPTVPGTVQIAVKDAQNGNHLSGVTFQLCTNSNSCADIPASETVTGVYNITAPSGTYSSLKISKAGYISADYQNLIITPNTTVILEQFLAIQGTYTGNGTVNGRIISATTAQPVPNVKLDIRAGLNNMTGTVVQTTQTSTTGDYTLTLPTGYYTVTGTAAGYEPLTYTVSVLGGQTVNAGDEPISPVLTEGVGAWRFVLDWGATPYDLDSHLTGPTAEGQRFHVYYSDKVHTDTLGSVNLDVDDVSSYGPETITVVDVPEGLLRYSVHDYSNRGSATSTAMADSGARVRVYQGQTLVRTFNVPSGAGDLWTVFTLDLTNPATPVLSPVNTVTTVGSPVQVQSAKPGVKQPINIP